MFEKTVTLCN